MNAEEIKLVINPIMETGDIKTAVNQIQGFFNKMNLSKGMKGDMESIFRELIDEAETFEKKSKEAFKTAGDVKSFQNSGKKIVSLFEKISQTMNKLGGEDLSKLFTIDDSRIASMTQEITKLQQKINSLSANEIKNVSTAIQQMNTVSKSGGIDRFFSAFKAGDMSAAENALKGLIQNVQAFGGSTAETKAAVDLMLSSFESGRIDEVKSSFNLLEGALGENAGTIKTYVSALGVLINNFAILSGNGDIAQARQDIQNLEQNIETLNAENVRTLATNFNAAAPAIEKCEQNTRDFTRSMADGAVRSQELNREIDELKNRATYFLSLENSVDLFRQGIRKAIETVKELDKAMAETAVVTDFSIGDMWETLPEYTKMANELGVATSGVYEASTLYYQQGLQTNEVMQLTNETLKMARIAGLECADATDLMTAALRGFNMEINETSAQRVNDIYSELAAITAADTNEIATAMTKTASIANNANMELETTAALLAQMIETTREPAETAGTAMKTIIARFTEMKKATSDLINVDGEEVSVNKVETALKSAGVALRDTNGEFRNLDDVFLDLAKRWGSLDIMTQRYIATTAAGSRQQSRFIAMMQDYDRTMELVDAAYGSAGASSQQFGKTQESLETKIAKLKNAWNEFLLGIANDNAIKAIIDLLTSLLNGLNLATAGASGFATSFTRIFTVIAALRIGKGIFNKLFSSIGGMMSQGGEKSAQQLQVGIQKGIDASQTKLSTRVSKMFKSIFKVPKGQNAAFTQAMSDAFNGKTSMKFDAFSNLFSNINTSQIASQSTQISTVFENSLKQQLDYGSMSQTGQQWIDSLIQGMKSELQSGTSTVAAAAEQLEQSVKEQFDEKADYQSGDKDKKQNVKKNIDSNGLEVYDEAVEKSAELETNLAAVGGALMTASMMGNMLVSSLAESGAMSEDTAKGISNLTTGLMMAGMALTTLKTIQQQFNITTWQNPYIAIAAIILGAVVAVAGAIGQAVEKQKELNKETIESAKTQGKEAKEIKEEVDAYMDLVDTYQETGEETDELKSKKKEIIELLGLEAQGVSALTSSYKEVADAAEKAAKKELEHAIASQKSGLQAAMSMVDSEGQFKAGGAGFTNGGSSFELDTTEADYEQQRALFEEVANELGIEGLTFSQGSVTNNLVVDGIGTSDEEQYKFLTLLSKVLARQDTETEGYRGLNELWGLIGEYYTSSEEIMSNSEDLEYSSAGYTAEEWWSENNQIITSMSEFNSAVNNIVAQLAGYDNLSEDQKKAIAIDALLADDESLQRYGQAYTQLLNLAGQEGFEAFIAGIDNTEIDLIINAEVVIDEDDTIDTAGQALASAEIKNSVFSATKLNYDLLKYANKINEGELTEEDKASLSNRLSSVEGRYGEGGLSAQQYWENVQDSDRASQLRALREISSYNTQKQSERREEIIDNLPNTIFVSPDAESAIGKYEDFDSDSRYYNMRFSSFDKIHKTGITPDNFEEYKEAYENYETYTEVGKKEDTHGVSQSDYSYSGSDPTGAAGVGFLNLMEDLAEGIDDALPDTENEKWNAEYDKWVTDENKAKHDAYEAFLESVYGDWEDPSEEYAEDYTFFTQTYPEKYGEYSPDGSVVLDENGQVDLNATAELYSGGFTNDTLNTIKTYDSSLGRELTQEEYDKLDTDKKYELLDANLKEYRASLGYQGLNNWVSADGTFNFADYSSNMAENEQYGNMSYAEIREADPNQFSSPEVQKYLQYLDDAGKIDLTKPWKEVNEQINSLTDEDFEIDADVDSLEEVNTQIEILDETMEEIDEIKIACDYAEVQAAISNMKLLTAEAENARNATDLIDGETYQVDTESYQQLMQMYPELLEGAVATENGLIQLNKQRVDTVIAGHRAELQAELDARKRNAESEKERLRQSIATAEAIRDGKADAAQSAAIIEEMVENQKTQNVAELSEKGANESISASNSSTEAIIKNINQQSAAFDKLGIQLNSVNAALRGGVYDPTTAVQSSFLPQGNYTSTTEWEDPEEIVDNYNKSKTALADYAAARANGETADIVTWLQNQKDANGNALYSSEDILIIGQIYNMANQQATDAQEELDNYDYNTTLLQAMINGMDDIGDGDGSGSDKDSEKRNFAEENEQKKLEALDRVRETNDREAELIGKLPEEIQGPLKLMNMAEDMAYEYQEIQINKNRLAALQSEQELANAEAMAKGMLGEQGSGAPIYYDEMLESYMWDVEAAEGLSEEEREKAHETKDSLDELNSSIQEVKSELDGGKIQKAFHTAGKAATAFSEALKDAEGETDTLGDAFAEFGKGTILEKPLKALGNRFEELIDDSKFLDKEFHGLGDTLDKIPVSDGLKNLVSSVLGEDAAGQMGSKGMGTAISGLFGEGGALAGMPGAETITQMMSGGPLQALFGAMTGDIGSVLMGMGDLLSFDMMGTGLDMFNQMKDMASQMIQYVVQFITTVINWWINREDWLYNLLSAIEQEVHNFNRQEQVEERFRLYSDEGLNDLVSAWEAMRESLEKQIDLNEQLIKSRQAELQFLNLTNLPFSPAFYYDYTEERVIENPWVYDIYVLLLDLGAMLPEIGQIFSSIKQLMEDNKKRMEDAVKEIEDAREEILELEKKQLELRTKYMEDEIELEELVMDTIIEKQQEEIDELSAMNDAISAGNEKLIETLNSNLDRIREMRENEKKEEELGEKERRLAYLRQDTSNANRKEIMDLKDELEDERRSYTDELIDQKISALEEQNELAAEQRQKQIDLLQGQLDYTEKYGLQWEEAQKLIKNGFDSEGRLRVGSELFDMLMSKEDFTSMGNGSTRQVQQIMDWNVTSIAAAAFREINDIWEEGFGNFKMSNDVHDQSRLHLWADREVDYIELPSWLSFLQPAVNTIQDYLWRTGTNIETFIDTSLFSGKNSSSILGKTVVPLLQELVGLIKGGIAERNKTSEADGVVDITDPGYVGEGTQSLGFGYIERFTNFIGDGLATMGEIIVSGFAKNNKSNNQTVQKVTETNIDSHPNFYITIDGGDPDSLIGIIQESANVGNSANVVGDY